LNSQKSEIVVTPCRQRRWPFPSRTYTSRSFSHVKLWLYIELRESNVKKEFRRTANDTKAYISSVGVVRQATHATPVVAVGSAKRKTNGTATRPSKEWFWAPVCVWNGFPGERTRSTSIGEPLTRATGQGEASVTSASAVPRQV